jgi:hypothetical protein
MKRDFRPYKKLKLIDTKKGAICDREKRGQDRREEKY